MLLNLQRDAVGYFLIALLVVWLLTPSYVKRNSVEPKWVQIYKSFLRNHRAFVRFSYVINGLIVPISIALLLYLEAFVCWQNWLIIAAYMTTYSITMIEYVASEFNKRKIV